MQQLTFADIKKFISSKMQKAVMEDLVTIDSVLENGMLSPDGENARRSMRYCFSAMVSRFSPNSTDAMSLGTYMFFLAAFQLGRRFQIQQMLVKGDKAANSSVSSDPSETAPVDDSVQWLKELYANEPAVLSQKLAEAAVKSPVKSKKKKSN